MKPTIIHEFIRRKPKWYVISDIKKELSSWVKSVFFFNFQLKLFLSKLHSHWIGPFIVTNVFADSAVEIQSEKIEREFKVN